MTAHNQCNVESPLLTPGKKENKGNDKQKRGWKDARDELYVSVETRKNLHREQMSTLPPWTNTTGGTWGRSNFSEILSEECFWGFPSPLELFHPSLVPWVVTSGEAQPLQGRPAVVQHS